MNKTQAVRGLLATTLATTLAATTLGVAAPAHAGEGGSYDITQIRTNNVVARSSSCVDVPVAVTWRTGSVAGDPAPREVYFSAHIEVWRGGSNVDSASIYDYSWQTGRAVATTRDTYLWCPYIDGLGTFRMGPSSVDGQTYDDYSNDLDSDTFLDRTTTTYVVRQAAAAGLGIVKVKRKPKLRQFTVVPKFFSLSNSAWRNWANKPVALQLSTSAGWKTVRVIKTTPAGVGKLRLASRRGYKYRIVVPGTSSTWSATSATRVAP